MSRGASLLVGEHDYRNFCKMDIGNVTAFNRNILSFTVERETAVKWYARMQHSPTVTGALVCLCVYCICDPVSRPQSSCVRAPTPLRLVLSVSSLCTLHLLHTHSSSPFHELWVMIVRG